MWLCLWCELLFVIVSWGQGEAARTRAGKDGAEAAAVWRAPSGDYNVGHVKYIAH